jgi:hypothetical protein
MHNVSIGLKMLGVHFSPVGNLGTHVDHMVQKGLDWVDCLPTKPLLSNDAWFSFYLQLFPAISWGLVTVCMPPSMLDKCFQKVYKKALPLLGVNCKIKREWRALPEKYQGLAMPNVPLVALAEKVSFLLGNWGFAGQAHSNALAMAFDNFLIQVGLYGSPLDWSYKDYGHLSTESTWLHNLWTLVHYFKASITFHEEDTVQGLRENNRSLMSDYFCVGYCRKDLVSLNIVRWFCNILHLSDISKCDSTTLDKFAVSDYSELSSWYVFPREEPTTTDFRIWKDAVRHLCSGMTTLPTRLGLYIRPPHLPMPWYTTEDTRQLYRVGDSPATPSYCTYNI